MQYVSKISNPYSLSSTFDWQIDCVWNVMAHAQKPDFVFRRNGRVHLNRRGRQFSRILAAEVCASAAVMLDTPCSEVVWRVLATHSFRQFPLHFPSRASPCAITFQLDSTTNPLKQDRSTFYVARERSACMWISWNLVKKVKQSRYRPRVDQRVPEVKVPRLHDNGTGWW
jgi:hypothetical protein